MGAIAFTLLTTWAKGRQLMINRMNEASLPMEIFIKSAAPSAARVPGTAVFMTSASSGVPHALLHNLKHNKVLHERVLLLTVRIEDVPFATAAAITAFSVAMTLASSRKMSAARKRPLSVRS